VVIDRESERIDSTGDLLREAGEIHGIEGDPAQPVRKPLLSRRVKLVLLADVVIVVAVAVFLIV